MGIFSHFVFFGKLIFNFFQYIFQIPQVFTILIVKRNKLLILLLLKKGFWMKMGFVVPYSSGFGSTHFSIRSLSSLSLKLTLTNMESAPLNGNMLSSAKSLGR